VSAPVTWDEVRSGAELWFGPDDVRERADRHGDLLAPLLELRQKLP
jgi:bifunctional non-homologous end joining protein LigD